MQKVFSDAIGKIKKNKKELEKSLNVKLSIKGREVTIEAEKDGDGLHEFIAERVIEALNIGFSVPCALQLRDEEYVFEKFNIKDISIKHSMKEVRARVIGTKGRTKRIMETLSDCNIVIHDNDVGIIGHAEDIDETRTALNSLVRGSKPSNVYSFLEKKRARNKLDRLKR
jgi:ribosomal RNA assembly protein